MRQAVARGRAVGPHPGRVDVRGKAGASRAIQAALRDATGRSPSALAAVSAVPGVAVLVSPRRRAPAGSLPLFDA